jgi:hypothetical protein
MQISKILASLLITFGAMQAANATVLTFDDIGIPNYVTSPGFIEQGFQFSNNSDVVDLSASSPWSAEGPAYSGNYAALNDYGGNMVMTAVGGVSFSLQDLYIKSWAGTTNGQSESIIGYLNGQQVGQVNFTMGNSWQDVAANFGQVTSVSINGGNYFLVDNVTVNAGNAVPEPATYSMMLMGLGLIGFMVSHKRSA